MSVLLVISLTVLLLGSAGDAAAQVVVKVPRGGAAIGVGYEGMQTVNDTQTGTTDRDLDTWLLLPLSGHVLDPGIMRYSLSLRPRLRRSTSTGLPAPIDSRDLALSFDTRLLTAKPLSLYLSWDRSSGRVAGGIGTRSDYDASGLAAGASWRNWLLPVNLHMSRRTSTGLTEVGVQRIPILRSDVTRNIRLAARNRKLSFAFDQTDFDDRLRDTDFSARNVDFEYRLTWGKGSGFTTSLRHHDRSGTLPFNQSNWTNLLRVQHTRTARTNLTFSRTASEGLGGRSSRQGFGWSFDMRPTRPLLVGARGSIHTSKFENGRQHMATVGPTLGYRFSLPFGATLSGRAGVSYVKRDLQGSNETLVPVLDEAHRVDESLAVLLDEPNVEEETILVRSVDGALLYVQGLDYEVQTTGNLTELLVLLGSRIETGQTILVSYRHLIVLDTRENGFVTRFSAALRLSGITVGHSRSRRATDTSDDGAGPISGDFDQSATFASANLRLPAGTIRLDLGHRSRVAINTQYDIDEARFSFLFPSIYRFRLSLDAAAFNSHQEQNMTRRLFGGSTLRWDPVPTLSLMGSVGVVNWEQSANVSERSLTVRAALEWRVGRFEALVRYNLVERDLERDLDTRVGWGRFSIGLVRRF